MKFNIKLPRNQIKKAKRSIRESYNRVVNSSYVRQEGDKIILNMFRTTRVLGKGIDEDGKRYKLPPLQDSTVDYRENYEVNLAPKAKPAKSNLTATGQLLEALANVSRNKKIIIELAPSRKFELDGRKSSLSNIEIKNFLEEKGFIFFNIPRSEIKRIVRELRQLLIKDFNK